MEVAVEDPSTVVTVDLEAQTVSVAGFDDGFEVDPFARECMLNGWDTVGLTLRLEDEIAAYEGTREPWLPRVTAG